jgi:hypothetical protein
MEKSSNVVFKYSLSVTCVRMSRSLHVVERWLI